jgi:hypothetical protein
MLIGEDAKMRTPSVVNYKEPLVRLQWKLDNEVRYELLGGFKGQRCS